MARKILLQDPQFIVVFFFFIYYFFFILRERRQVSPSLPDISLMRIPRRIVWILIAATLMLGVLSLSGWSLPAALSTPSRLTSTFSSPHSAGNPIPSLSFFLPIPSSISHLHTLINWPRRFQSQICNDVSQTGSGSATRNGKGVATVACGGISSSFKHDSKLCMPLSCVVCLFVCLFEDEIISCASKNKKTKFSC